MVGLSMKPTVSHLLVSILEPVLSLNRINWLIKLCKIIGLRPMASKTGTLPERMYSHNNSVFNRIERIQFTLIWSSWKCPACMMGKGHSNNMPRRKDRSNLPLAKVQMDIFQSSIMSIEGNNYARVVTNDCTGYRWLYGLKTKDDILFSRQSRSGIRSGTATLLNSVRCTIYLWSCETMLEKMDPMKFLNSWIKRNPELFQHPLWTVAKWPRWIVNQFLIDPSTMSHGRVRTWWTILVQCRNGCEGCVQYDLQGSYPDDSVYANVRSQVRYI